MIRVLQVLHGLDCGGVENMVMALFSSCVNFLLARL